MNPLASLPIGFGTAGFETPRVAFDSVERAIDVGYRHIDTAQQYRHTEAVGAAIAASEISRDGLLVASKLHSENLGYDAVLSETKGMLTELGLDTLDFLYIHWPAHSYVPDRTFAAMETLYEDGTVSHLGVCNFSIELLREATSVASAPILANQVEMHPFLPQDELLAFCRQEGIHVVAHSPFASGAIFDSPVLQDIAAKHDASVPQVVLAWLGGRKGVTPVPKATGCHIEENYDSTTLELDRRDITAIDAIEREHRVVDYDFAPWNT